MTSKEAKGWMELILPVVTGLLIAGTGGWTGERWGWGLTVMGFGPAMKMKYDQGYWTPNPNLDTVARQLSTSGHEGIRQAETKTQAQAEQDGRA